MKLKNYIYCNNGNIAIMFAVSSFVILGIVGLTIDSSSAYSARAKLQDACDTVALAAATATYDGSVMDKKASALQFNDNFSLTEDTLKPKIHAKDGKSTCEANYKLKTSFGSLFGMKNVEINVSSEAEAILNPKPVSLSVSLENMSSDAWYWNQLYLYTYNGNFDENSLASRVLLMENKTAPSDSPGDQVYIDSQTGTNYEVVIPAGYEYGFELSVTPFNGSTTKYYSHQTNPNHQTTGDDCLTENITHSWEDKIGGDNDFDDMEYAISCEYEGGGGAPVAFSRLVQ